MVTVSITIVGATGVNLTLQGGISDEPTLAALKKLTDKLAGSVMDAAPEPDLEAPATDEAPGKVRTSAAPGTTAAPA